MKQASFVPGKHSKPVTWEEGDYTVTRTSSWSPPGDHPTGAGMLIYVNKDGIIEKVEGDPEHPITHGGVPMRLLALPEYVYHPDRVIYPLKRDPSKRGDSSAWERITWDEAYAMIENKAREVGEKYGENAIVTWVGTGRQVANWGSTISCSVFNSAQVCYTQSGWSCYGPRMAVTSYVLGVPYPEIDNASEYALGFDDPRYVLPECVLIWGKEPLKSNPDGFWGHSIIEMLKRGTELVVVDPRLTFLASKAKYWLQLRPGTDGALALAMLNVIIGEGLYDRDFVENWCFGFDELAQRVQDMPPSRAAEICDVSEDAIIAAAHFFATAKPSSVQWGLAVDQNPNGVQVAQCLASIMAICGCIDRPGGNCIGAIDLGSQGSGYGDVEPQSKFMGEIGFDEFPALCRTIMMASPDSMLDELEKDDPSVKMSIYWGANTIACAGNVPERWLKGVNKLEFNIIADLFHSPTSEALCDLFLPVATFVEADGYVATEYGSCATWIGAINKVIEPVGECKSDITILRELGHIMRPELWDFESDREYLNKKKLEPVGLSFEELAENGWMYIDYHYEKYATGDLRPGGEPGFVTPTGRVELYSSMMESWGDDPLPYYIEPVVGPVADPDMAKEYPLVLTTGQRTWSYFHSEGRQVPTWREFEPDPLVEVNPDDAAELAIKEGDWVWLENPTGSCKMKVSLQAGVKKGVVAAQHAWWYPERSGSAPELFGLFEANINNLVPYKTIGKLGFGAPYKSLLCRIRRAD